MGRIVSEGKSVRVTVPAGVVVTQGDFYQIDGYLGWAAQTVDNPLAAEPVILNTAVAEYETSQLDPAAPFAAVGDPVYFDAGAGLLTNVAGGNLYAGRITSPRDADDVIWFLFDPCDIVGAVVAGAAVADVASPDGAAAAGANPTAAEFDAVVLVANENKAQINALLVSLRNAGIINP